LFEAARCYALAMSLLLAYAMGFSVASMPGPILALIATETLRKGAWPGAQTALAPMCVDACVMLPLVMVLQSSIPSGAGAMAIGIAGGAFLCWLGVQSFRAGSAAVAPGRHRGSRSLPPFLKGVLTQLMNPYAFIFWGTVGFAFVREGFEAQGLKGALSFPAGFWLGAGTMNFLVVYLVSRGRRFLPARTEPYVHAVSGALLTGAGAFLAWAVVRDHL